MAKTVKDKKSSGRSRDALWDGKFKLFMLFNGALLVVILSYVMHLKQLEADVITPLDALKMVTKEGLEVPERYWGSYRSQMYFGMKNRHRDPVNFGLMWFDQKPRGNSLNIRHWCSQRDGLKKYTWLKHDGIHFGEQILLDGQLNITTSFVKRTNLKAGGEWSARVSVETIQQSNVKKAEPISLFFYSMADISTHNLDLNLVDKTRVESITGESPDVGLWRLRFLESGSAPVSYNYLSTVIPAPEEVVDVVQRSVRAVKLKDFPTKMFFTKGKMFAVEDHDKKPNFVMTQVTVTPPYTMEIIFENTINDEKRDIETELSGGVYDEELSRHRKKFDEKFSQIFPLGGNYAADQVEAAKAALSNMVGSIGYFFGQSLVRGPDNKDLALYWPATLYTAVPSRSFFPRGFLWDEGFHDLLITRWNPEISKDIVGHWLDLMNKNGWIPREQILGAEARAAVPNEFIVQRSSNANPPTLFLTVELMLDMMRKGEMSEDIDFIKRAYPRLERIYQYFREEQNGKDPLTFRWRGRDAEIRTELNPKTLASGLDDYPRASHPTDDERHVDLRCWVALMARVLSEIGQRLKLEVYAKYQRDYMELRDNRALNDVHWSAMTKQYSDYGLHTDNVLLVSQKSPPGEPSLPMVRFTRTAPKLQLVDEFGYVSLFPLMMKLLDSDSVQLTELLKKLDDPNLLWTEYGLRSLSKNSKLYESRNTEHDPPYWRGNIWINMNFMVISGLKHYSKIEGPNMAVAKLLHDKLKHNVIKNVLGEFKRTGYFWENYKADTGKGHGCQPFTGWTALVVLLMGDQY